MNKIMKIFIITLLFGVFCLFMPMRADASVKLNKKNFPDKNLRTYLKTFDKNNNGWLSNKEIKKIQIVYDKDASYDDEIKPLKISRLRGIEYLKYLKRIAVLYTNNKTAILDLTNNKKLVSVSIRNHEKTVPKTKKIKLNGLTNLKDLYIEGYNKLNSLDISSCKRLRVMSIKKCAIKKLVGNANNIAKLQSLTLNNCKFKNGVNFKYFKNLKYLELKNMPIKKDINLSKLKKLKTLKLENLWNIDRIILPSKGNLSNIEIENVSDYDKIENKPSWYDPDEEG